MRTKPGGPMPVRFLVSHAGKNTISHYPHMIDFQALFIWLAQEHRFRGSWALLAAPRSSLGAHGGSWRLLVLIYIISPLSISSNSLRHSIP